MDVTDLIAELDLWRQLTAAVVGMPRLFMVLMVAPFFGASVVTGRLRTIMALAVYLPIHPLVAEGLPAGLALSPDMAAGVAGGMILIILKEVLVGLMLGFLAGIPFWAVQSAGFLVDNQRGASMAELAEILGGEQNSPTGNMLFQCMIYLLYSTGAFLAIVGAVHASYEAWPAERLLPSVLPQAAALAFAGRVAWLVGHMLLLAGPIVAACLLTDLSLGLVSRFAQQLNVYVLAMPIKSGLASFLLCFYLGLLLSHVPDLLNEMLAGMALLPSLMGIR